MCIYVLLFMSLAPISCCSKGSYWLLVKCQGAISTSHQLPHFEDYMSEEEFPTVLGVLVTTERTVVSTAATTSYHPQPNTYYTNRRTNLKIVYNLLSFFQYLPIIIITVSIENKLLFYFDNRHMNQQQINFY